MKVKILEGRAGKDYVMKKGEIVEVSENFGKPLIDKGKAELVENERSTDKGAGQQAQGRTQDSTGKKPGNTGRSGKSYKAGHRSNKR